MGRGQSDRTDAAARDFAADGTVTEKEIVRAAGRYRQGAARAAISRGRISSSEYSPPARASGPPSVSLTSLIEDLMT